MARPAAIAATLLFACVITTWPVHPFVGHSHWPGVEWVPFSRRIAPLDVVANIVVFIPLGAAIAWPGDRRRVRLAIAAAALVSLLAETYQVYCHDAFPTMTDVLANTGGAALGAMAVRLRRFTGQPDAPRHRPVT